MLARTEMESESSNSQPVAKPIFGYIYQYKLFLTNSCAIFADADEPRRRGVDGGHPQNV